MCLLLDGFLKAVGAAKSWMAQKHQLNRKKNLLRARQRLQTVATPPFVTRNFLAAWVIIAQPYRFGARSSKGRNNKLCVALHAGVLIT